MDPNANTQGNIGQQNATAGTTTGVGVADKVDFREILMRETLAPQVKSAIRQLALASYIAGANNDAASPQSYVANTLPFLGGNYAG